MATVIIQRWFYLKQSFTIFPVYKWSFSEGRLEFGVREAVHFPAGSYGTLPSGCVLWLMVGIARILCPAGSHETCLVNNSKFVFRQSSRRYQCVFKQHGRSVVGQCHGK